MAEVFIQLSVIILIVLGVSLIMRALKQPLIVGYILSGILIGPFVLNIAPESETLEIFSTLGIAFLLFIVGLHLSPKTLKDVGKISLITGIGQIVFTSLIGYILSILLGFSPLIALYIAIALTFSSTIIIMKLLSDKEDLDKLYGKISVGFLLVQDFVVILMLIIISSISTGENYITEIGITLLKGIVIVALLIPVSLFVLPKCQRFFAKSQEFLFVFSIAWGLGFASLFYYAGLTIEVGALLAGILLSISPYNLEISSRLKPLRDFFIISFFLTLGAQMMLEDISQYALPAIILSLFILIGNPLIVMILMGLKGYTKKIGFSAGLTVAQISEFSLILIALGVNVGHLPSGILSFVTVVGIVTISGSTYMIMYSDKIYNKISKYLSIFEKKNILEEQIPNKKIDTILFGYNRIGFGILKSLKDAKENYLVVDFDPEVISILSKMKEPYAYGDLYDYEFLDRLPLKKIKKAISTIPEPESNKLLIEIVKKKNPNALVIVRAHNIRDALELYEKGADYVLTPHFLGGEYLARMIREFKGSSKKYEKEKKTHKEMLKEISERGKDHPPVERG